MSHGGGRTRLNEDRFLGITVPLPLLSEQRCIVGKVENLAVRLRNSQMLRLEAADAAEGLVGAYIDSVFEDEAST